MNTRTYLAAHAPAPPSWFQPDMPPEPNVFNFPNVRDLTDHFPKELKTVIEATIERLTDEEIHEDEFVSEVACSGIWSITTPGEASDEQLDLLRAFVRRVDAAKGVRAAHQDWTRERDVQRTVQWSLRWADALIRADVEGRTYTSYNSLDVETT